MANEKISAMPASTGVADADLFPGVQDGVNVKVTGAQIKAYAGGGFSLTTTLTAGTDVAAGTVVSQNAAGAGVQTWGPEPVIDGLVPLFDGAPLANVNAISALVVDPARVVVFGKTLGAQALTIGEDNSILAGGVDTSDPSMSPALWGPGGTLAPFATGAGLTDGKFALNYDQDGIFNAVVGGIDGSSNLTYGTPQSTGATETAGVQLIAFGDGAVLQIAANGSSHTSAAIGTVTGTDIAFSDFIDSGQQYGTSYAVTKLAEFSAFLAWGYFGLTDFAGVVIRPGGAISASEVDAGGANYVPGDTGTITAGSGDAAYEISTTDGSGGPIVASSVHVGGIGYAPGDAGTIDGGTGDATFIVDTVDGGGAILTYTLDNPGTTYATGSANATTATTGIGVGFTIDITSVGGAVTAYTLSAPGTIYPVQNGLATSATSGVGSGLTIDVTAIGSVAGPVFGPIATTTQTSTEWDVATLSASAVVVASSNVLLPVAIDENDAVTFGNPLTLFGATNNNTMSLAPIDGARFFVQSNQLFSSPLIGTIAFPDVTVSAFALLPKNSKPVNTLAAFDADMIAFQDAQFSIYEMDADGNVSLPIEHQGLTNYWLYPLDEDRALAVLVNDYKQVSARVILRNPVSNGPRGLTATGATNGNPLTVVTAGECAVSGLTAGSRYFANGDGTLTTANTGHPIGFAKDANTMVVQLGA